jgi:hypothetical protein
MQEGFGYNSYSDHRYPDNKYPNSNYQDIGNSNNKYSNNKYSNEYFNEKGLSEYCVDCVITHDEKYGRNYEWFDVLGHGHVIKVWYEEPVGSSKFVLYTTKWWETHCEVVSRGKNLYNAHIKAFVDPKTRFAKMLFEFSDGSLI